MGGANYRAAWKALFLFEEAYKNNDKEKQYLHLSQFIQSLFISENGYVMDTGGYREANMAIMEDILKKIEAHPHLWKLFMVA